MGGRPSPHDGLDALGHEEALGHADGASLPTTSHAYATPHRCATSAERRGEERGRGEDLAGAPTNRARALGVILLSSAAMWCSFSRGRAHSLEL